MLKLQYLFPLLIIFLDFQAFIRSSAVIANKLIFISNSARHLYTFNSDGSENGHIKQKALYLLHH